MFLLKGMRRFHLRFIVVLIGTLLRHFGPRSEESLPVRLRSQLVLITEPLIARLLLTPEYATLTW